MSARRAIHLLIGLGLERASRWVFFPDTTLFRYKGTIAALATGNLLVPPYYTRTHVRASRDSSPKWVRTGTRVARGLTLCVGGEGRGGGHRCANTGKSTSTPLLHANTCPRVARFIS